jgi:hypothetical protein
MEWSATNPSAAPSGGARRVGLLRAIRYTSQRCPTEATVTVRYGPEESLSPYGLRSWSKPHGGVYSSIQTGMMASTCVGPPGGLVTLKVPVLTATRCFAPSPSPPQRLASSARQSWLSWCAASKPTRSAGLVRRRPVAGPRSSVLAAIGPVGHGDPSPCIRRGRDAPFVQNAADAAPTGAPGHNLRGCLNETD